MRNDFKTHIEVTRMDICDLMLACTSATCELIDNAADYDKVAKMVSIAIEERETRETA